MNCLDFMYNYHNLQYLNHVILKIYILSS